MGLLAPLLLLAACADTGGQSPFGESPYPGGIDPYHDSVDGLIVGHRMMAAGEYELALKAYIRAASEQGLNADVLSAIGSANIRLGRLGQAEKQLRQAIEHDEKFAAAWNNLGVVLMEQGNYGEAARVFQTAFALDSGESAEIRDNLRLALAKVESTAYDEPQEHDFALVRRGPGNYLLLATP